ncbi:peptidyl-prolyl cis-trans isomerase FKBP16-4, chloroplastic-like [Aristolochia californica]|uniref:peptidyl-prolyl cis-trans isomerase FKBP16-4, chloroplastic-like n=1 Tax=Aristolochia californica TaxID=171875 RepID=UPI0035D6BBDE
MKANGGRLSSKTLPVQCSGSSETSIPAAPTLQYSRRRSLISLLLAGVAGEYISDVASAVSTSRRALRGVKIPDSEYTTLPNGLNLMASMLDNLRREMFLKA